MTIFLAPVLTVLALAVSGRCPLASILLAYSAGLLMRFTGRAERASEGYTPPHDTH